MLKKTIKIIAFLICTLILFLFAVRILQFKSPDGIDQMRAFYNNEENTVDVLFLGSSHMYTNVNTGILWSDYGISAYNLGAAEQPFWNAYYCLKEALKTQTPKVIVLEIYSAAIQETDFQSRRWTTDNLFGMRFSRNFVEAEQESIKDDFHLDYLNRFARYHSRYTMITKDDFIYDDEMKSFKGFVPKLDTNPQERVDVGHVTEASCPNEKMDDYLIEIIDLAGEENIPILLVCAPYVIKEESQMIFNYFYQYADEIGVPYLDFNVRYDELGLEFSQDFFDWSHLNAPGNAKYTNYLGNYLKENYDLPDHRGDERYASWDENAESLEHELAAFQLPRTNDLTEYLNRINQDDYIILMSARDRGDGFTFSEEVLQQLAGFGMDQDMWAKDGNIVWRGGVTEVIDNGMNDSWYMECDGNDFCIDRTQTESLDGHYEETMQDNGGIIVNGTNYFKDGCELNIVVYDTVLKKVVDAIGIKSDEEVPIIR